MTARVRIACPWSFFDGCEGIVLEERTITHNGSSTPMVLVQLDGEKRPLLYGKDQVAPLLPFHEGES